MAATKRTYELKERAKRQAETRQRIVEATAALHEEVGPARTTVAEIARRAGVQRLTVYTHFPEERELFAACSGHWVQQHLPPDPSAWAAIEDPARRLRRALADLHAWYRDGEQMFAHVERDMEALPALRAVVSQSRGAYVDAVRDLLGQGLARPGTAAARRMRGALGLAVGFGAWQALVREDGVSDKDAVEILARAVEASAAG